MQLVSGPKKQQITIRDVARLSDVSYQTVSRVINNSPNVSPETRQRVLRAMRSLNYKPNKAAQMLNTNKSQIIQVITLEGKFPFNIPLPEAAGKAGYSAIYAECTMDTFAETLDTAASRMVDGIILYAPKLDIDDHELLEMCNGIPLVRRDYAIGSKKITWVGFDQVRATELAVQHLLDLGHEQIAEVTGDLNAINAHVRHDTVRKYLKLHGLEAGPYIEGDYTTYERANRSGYECTVELLARGEPFTALMVANDSMAIGALYALYEHGIHVPDEISLISFDNAAHAQFTIPPLTTVNFSFDVQNKLAFQFLFELIEDPDTKPHQHILLPELLVRQSTRQIG